MSQRSFLKIKQCLLRSWIHALLCHVTLQTNHARFAGIPAKSYNSISRGLRSRSRASWMLSALVCVGNPTAFWFHRLRKLRVGPRLADVKALAMANYYDIQDILMQDEVGSQLLAFGLFPLLGFLFCLNHFICGARRSCGVYRRIIGCWRNSVCYAVPLLTSLSLHCVCSIVGFSFVFIVSNLEGFSAYMRDFRRLCQPCFFTRLMALDFLTRRQRITT